MNSMKITLGFALLVLAALPVRSADFAIQRVMGKSSAQVDATIGRPLSVGEGGTFREYGTKNSGWYVRFTAGKATQATITFRKPFSTPEAALKAIGIKPGKAKSTKTTFLLRSWTKLGGLTSVTVRSLDGKHWDTIEVAK